jgi:hypothetical protein
VTTTVVVSVVIVGAVPSLLLADRADFAANSPTPSLSCFVLFFLCPFSGAVLCQGKGVFVFEDPAANASKAFLYAIRRREVSEHYHFLQTILEALLVLRYDIVASRVQRSPRDSGVARKSKRV